MKLIHTVEDLHTYLHSRVGSRIGFVPTMGNLHAGHCHLVEIAKQHSDLVVVSIFVNPLQFGVNEDFDKYPRTLKEDCEKLLPMGVAVVFAPAVAEIYPDFDGRSLNQSVMVQPQQAVDILCGTSRPGHFAGVATVVTKLFNIVRPNVAVFGKKDYQQLTVIRHLVRQFNIHVKILAAETIREPSGLAMSSRNAYLSPDEKSQASDLYKQLRGIGDALLAGAKDFDTLCKCSITTLENQGWQVDYIEIRSQNNLTPADNLTKQFVILAAAKLGRTRLIDNCEIALA